MLTCVYGKSAWGAYGRAGAHSGDLVFWYAEAAAGGAQRTWAHVPRAVPPDDPAATVLWGAARPVQTEWSQKTTLRFANGLWSGNGHS